MPTAEIGANSATTHYASPVRFGSTASRPRGIGALLLLLLPLPRVLVAHGVGPLRERHPLRLVVEDDPSSEITVIHHPLCGRVIERLARSIVVVVIVVIVVVVGGGGGARVGGGVRGL